MKYIGNKYSTVECDITLNVLHDDGAVLEEGDQQVERFRRREIAKRHLQTLACNTTAVLKLQHASRCGSLTVVQSWGRRWRGVGRRRDGLRGRVGARWRPVLLTHVVRLRRRVNP